MASAQATERLTNGKRASGEIDDRRIRPIALEGVHEALQRTTNRTIRRDRLERDDRAYRWCIRKAFAEGNPFRSSIAQAARGMGYETSGDSEEDFVRWNSTVHRALNSLEVAGLITWGGVKRENGAWSCIEVKVVPNDLQRTIMVVM
jgi:hypothetical protein